MRMRLYKKIKFLICILFLLQLSLSSIHAQVEVAPLSCYPQFATAAEMDAAAASGGSPFATWKGAYDYAIANGESIINFAPGTYNTDLSGASTDWGDADGGFVLTPGMIVNGNGAVINNTPNAGSGQLCFATLASTSIVSNFVFKQMTGNPNGGALYVPSNATGWSIISCEFNNCNLGTDAVTINMGPGQTGTIESCFFYGNSNPAATYPASPGLPSSSAMNITGAPTSNLNINNTIYSCNFRNVSGGAVKIRSATNVNFTGCTFYRNEANSSRGGAIDIGNDAIVTFTNTNFIENFTTGSGTPLGGAMAIEDGATVTATGCIFKLNSALEDGGAIYIGGPSASSVSNLSLSNSILEDNSVSSGKDGGALYVTSYSNTTVTNCLFLNNTSPDKGGAIWMSATTSPKTLTINGSTFTGNNSGSSEGAITSGFGASGDVLNINNCISVNSGSPRDIEDEGAGTTTVSNSYYGIQSGIVDGGGNTANYTPSFDINYNDSSGAGWTGVYSSPVGAGFCPSPPSVANDCTEQGSISGTVWDDGATPDGNIATGSPMPGITVNLLDDTGAIVATVVTGADGTYFFGGLPNGATYTIEFVPPPGYFATIPNDSTAGTSNDSDINTSFRTPAITICTTCGNNGSLNTNDDTSGSTHYSSYNAGFTTSTVPVVMTSFEVYAQKENVKLIWATSSELNNDRFEIEHSMDGYRFEHFKTIEGNGNSSTLINYTTIHTKPERGVNYYRIKQVDFDGQYTYSNIQSIYVAYKSDLRSVAIFPNPSKGEVTVQLPEGVKAKELYVFGVDGQQKVKFVNLVNNQIDLSALEEGVYLISLKDTNNIRYDNIKWVKLNR